MQDAMYGVNKCAAFSGEWQARSKRRGLKLAFCNASFFVYAAVFSTFALLRLSLSTTSAMAPSPVTLQAVPKLSIAM